MPSDRPRPVETLPGPHARTPDTVARELGVDPLRGLDPAVVDERHASLGPNALEERRPERLRSMIVETVSEPFILLLAGAGALAVLLGEVRDGLLILVALVPIAGAEVVTEYRAERALDALREASAPRARVRRSGAVTDIPATGLVPGDVVLLRAGDVVPADLRLTRADRLLADRSLLTGESVPEPGAVAPDPPGAPLVDRRSMAWAGTAIVGGRGEGIVTAIGRATEMGRIAGSLVRAERRRSPLQQELDRLVRMLLVVAVVLVAITTGLGFLRGQDAGANVLAGISAAIAAIPEEPPILLAVILGLGAYRLLRRGVLVRRLNAEEALGAIDLIVTDKTGTLTENRLEVASVRTPAGPLAGSEARIPLLREALRAEDDAWQLDAGVAPGSFTRALGRAIEQAGEEAGVGMTAAGEAAVPAGPTALADPPVPAALDPAMLLEARGVSDARPFSSTRARVGARVVELAVGAPEAILALAAGPALPPGAQGTDRPDIGAPGRNHSDAEAWRAQLDAGAASGERILALARRDDAGPWRMRALIGFADPLRPGIREAMATAAGAGIQTVMVTGDHPRTAAAIARRAGLEADRVVLGDELRTWSADRVAAELGGLHVVARSVPEDKERLVGVARKMGRMVAVTGDGVNDAPALQRADVAVAMGSGTAVAREASDLVLGDDSFATLLYGLAEGRRIVDNVQKGLVFLISSHVALLGFILIATLYGIGQPLLPIQILWLELFIDVSTSIAFEREPREPDLMARRPRRRGEPLLPAWLLGRIVAAGSYSAVAALALLVAAGDGGDHGRWLAFSALVVGQVVRAYANRSLRTPVHRLARNGVLATAIAFVLLGQALIPAVPALADAFRATPLDAGDWLLVAAVGLAPALLAEGIRAARPGTTWVA